MKKYALIAVIIAFSASCHQESINKVFNYIDYSPDLVINKIDSLKLDLDEDKQEDILFYIDTTVLNYPTDTFVKYGVYVTFIKDSIEFSYGIRGGSASFSLLQSGDEINNTLDWDHFLTLDGVIRWRGFRGDLNYLGLRRRKLSNYEYGWIHFEATDSTLKVFESFLNYDETIPVNAGIK